jgi:hypothetical protein
MKSDLSIDIRVKILSRRELSVEHFIFGDIRYTPFALKRILAFGSLHVSDTACGLNEIERMIKGKQIIFAAFGELNDLDHGGDFSKDVLNWFMIHSYLKIEVSRSLSHFARDMPQHPRVISCCA